MAKPANTRPNLERFQIAEDSSGTTASTKVSDYSDWDDDVWQLDYEAHKDRGTLRIHWINVTVGDGIPLTSSSPKWVRPLLETARHFAWYLLYHRIDGPVAGTTAITRLRIFTRLLTFVTRHRDCRTLQDVQHDDVEAFVALRVKELSGADGTVSSGSINALYAAFRDLDEARDYMRSSDVQHLAFTPWPGESVKALVQRHKHREKEYVHPVPEPAGRMIVREACHFIDRLAIPVAEAVENYLHIQTGGRALPGNGLSTPHGLTAEDSNLLATALSENADIGRVYGHDRPTAELEATPSLLSNLSADIVGAATIILQALTGVRVGEVLQLRKDCVTREVTTDGRWYLYLLRINRDKTDDGWISIFAGMCPTATPPPDHDSLDVLSHPDRDLLPLPVRAVAAMRALWNAPEDLGLVLDSNRDFLFPRFNTRTMGRFREGAMTSAHVLTRQITFVRRRPVLQTALTQAYIDLAELLDLEEVPDSFVTHSWRKWFTESVIAYDQFDEDYPELQRHLGHVVGSVVTRENYASGGIEYRLMAENVFQERAARAMLMVIERRLKATGRLAKSLLKERETILEGSTPRTILERTNAVRRYLEDAGITVVSAGNNSGICAYRPEHAKCWNSLSRGKRSVHGLPEAIPGRDWVSDTGTAPLGPNRALARASLCRQCANFMLTEDQVVYWVNAAEDLNKLADSLERSPEPTQEDLYEAHAHRANAADYLTFVEGTLRRMAVVNSGAARE